MKNLHFYSVFFLFLGNVPTVGVASLYDNDLDLSVLCKFMEIR